MVASLDCLEEEELGVAYKFDPDRGENDCGTELGVDALCESEGISKGEPRISARPNELWRRFREDRERRWRIRCLRDQEASTTMALHGSCEFQKEDQHTSRRLKMLPLGRLTLPARAPR